MTAYAAPIKSGSPAAPSAASGVAASHAKPKMTAQQRAAAAAAAVALLAPADEYFGPLKQSVIGITNTIRTLGWNYDVNHDLGDRTFSSAGLTERAIKDWEAKYPHDDQLPHALYLLQRLYTKVLTQSSRDHSKFIAKWLLADFAKSAQARILKKTLAFEQLPPLPTPSPAPTPTYESIFGPQYPSEFAQPSAIPAPALTPAAPAAPAAPAPAPSASPTSLGITPAP